MHWEKKICIRVTLRRIVGALVLASIIANLVIVGAVFGASSIPSTPTLIIQLTTRSWTYTPLSFTSSASSTSTSTPTGTSTLTQTSTGTPTATQTVTNQPTLTVCAKRFDWFVYRVEFGDSLYSLGIATGSTSYELKVANCLDSDRIVVGQLLYVPRLLDKPTPTDTATTSPPDTFTVFEQANGYPLCDETANLYFEVIPRDPEGIRSVTLFYTTSPELTGEALMIQKGELYYYDVGRSTSETVSYSFQATDGVGRVFTSQTYSFSNLCLFSAP